MDVFVNVRILLNDAIFFYILVYRILANCINFNKNPKNSQIIYFLSIDDPIYTFLYKLTEAEIIFQILQAFSYGSYYSKINYKIFIASLLFFCYCCLKIVYFTEINKNKCVEQ